MSISRQGKRRLFIAALVIAIYSIVGFAILPPIAKSQLEKRGSALLGRRVTVETVRLNPFTLSVSLRDFAIREADGTTRFVGWKRLDVNFDALSSLFGEWVLSEIELDGFYARGVLNPDQSLNCSDLIARLAPPQPAGAKPPAQTASRPIRIGHLVVTNAQIDVSDLTRPTKFATTVGPLSFDLTGFRTVAERGAPYRFEAVTESGEKLAWTGTIRAQPFQSAGELRLEQLVLAKYAPYYRDRIQGEVIAGTLSVQGKYDLDLTENHRVLKLDAGAVQLRQFALRENGAAANAVDLPAIDVTGIQADALTMKASIASVVVSGGHARIRRDPNGAINLLTLVTPPATGAAPPVAVIPPAAGPAAPAKAAPLPEVTIGEFATKDFQVDLLDRAAPRAATCTLSGLQVSLKQVTLAEGASMPLHVAFNWAPKGTVQIDGTVGLKPMKADLKMAVAGFAFMPLSPYLEQFANVHLTQGELSTTLAAQASLADGKPPVASVSGDVTIENLAVVDGTRNEDLAGVTAIGVHGLRAAAGDTMAVAIDQIDVVKPYARVAVAADGTLNLATLVKRTPPTPPVVAAPAVVAPAETATAKSSSAQPKIEIGKIVIADGDFRFADSSLTPGVSTALSQFGGTITGLSSTNPGKGEMDLKGVVDGSGPVSIAGKFDPLGPTPQIDMKVAVKNVDLLPVGPYSGKFAGYELARGKLLVNVALKVDGKKIDATNVITLNQFTFGNPVQSPDATKLPVRLAIALLKDMDGKIVIDVPIQGSTDDPDFKIGGVVVRVIVNLLTKAAVSPFSLLGAAFGGGGEELAFQEFAPGAFDLNPAEVKKLDTMVKALTNRPGLSLDLEGSFDAAADTYALKRAKLADRIRRAIWDEKHRLDANTPPPEKLAITDAENAAMIKKLFDQTFPPGTKFGTPVPPPPAVVAPPAPPPAGWFKRVIRALTFEERRAAKQAAAESARLSAEHEQAVAAAVATGLPTEEMLGRLAEATPIDDNDLRALAQARAQRVRDYLRDVGKIAPERLFLAKATTTAEPEAAAKTGKGPRVFLTLQ